MWCDSPKTMQKLCLSTKFPQQKIRWNFSIFHSEWKHQNNMSQWRIQRLSDPGIPVWASKLGAQIKGDLMQSNISHSNHIFNANASTRSQKFNWSKTLKNVELKTLYMPGSATQVCLNVSQCIGCIKEFNISVASMCPN